MSGPRDRSSSHERAMISRPTSPKLCPLPSPDSSPLLDPPASSSSPLPFSPSPRPFFTRRGAVALSNACATRRLLAAPPPQPRAQTLQLVARRFEPTPRAHVRPELPEHAPQAARGHAHVVPPLPAFGAEPHRALPTHLLKPRRQHEPHPP